MFDIAALQQNNGMVMNGSFLSCYPLVFDTPEALFEEIDGYDQFDDWLEHTSDSDSDDIAERFAAAEPQLTPIAIFGHSELADLGDEIEEHVLENSQPSDEEFIVAVDTTTGAVMIWDHSVGFEKHAATVDEFLKTLVAWDVANDIEDDD